MNDNFYKHLIEKSPIGYAYHRIIYSADDIPCNFEFIEINPAYEAFTGLKGSDIIGKSFSDVLPEIAGSSDFNWVGFYGDIALNGGKKEFEQYVKPMNKWYRINVYSPEKYYFVTYISDITKEKLQLIELEENRLRMENIIEGTNVGTWEWNIQTGEVIHNERWANIFGYTLEELYPITIDTWKRFLHPDDLKDTETQDDLIFNKKLEYYNDEYRMRHKDGSWVWIHDRGKVITWTNDGKPHLISGTHTDITERKKLEAALANEKKLLETTLLSVADGVISTDISGNVMFLNKAAQLLTDWTQEEAKGSSFKIIFNTINEQTRVKNDNIVDMMLKVGSTYKINGNSILISKNGTEISIENSAAPIIQDDGKIVGVVLVFRDCSEKKKKHEEILYLSYHDQLTGLYNRRYYEEELNRIDKKRNLPLTLLLADVNGLKLINDSFGHDMGDELLKKVSEVIRSVCRGDEIIARLGGDEFVIILPKTDASGTEQIINRIKGILIEEKVCAVNISISFGYGTKNFEHENIQEVFKIAEDHMYRHKLYERSSIRNKTIELIMNTLYEKSNREMLHSKRVSILCEEIALEMNFDKDNVNKIRIAGLMHDIGKMGIDEKILNKPQGLTANEWKEIKRHPEIGYRILISSNEFSEMAIYILEHHERWDGKGYPKGLKGEKISLQARIIAVADSYDAMVSERPYLKSLSKEDAISEIMKGIGTQFDPNIAEIFIKLLQKKDI